MIETFDDAATNILTPTKNHRIVIPGTDQIIYLDKEEYKKFDSNLNKFTTEINNTIKHLKMEEAVKYINDNDSIPAFIKLEILKYDNTEKGNKMQHFRKK